MNEEVERRLARNEALFRETNEAIERGHFPGEPDKVVRFRCECAVVECDQAIELTLAEYEQVRENPRRFFVARDHVAPEVEEVVGRTDRYLVVEKRGAAGEEVAHSMSSRH
jgi:hypothetical protein